MTITAGIYLICCQANPMSILYVLSFYLSRKLVFIKTVYIIIAHKGNIWLTDTKKKRTLNQSIDLPEENNE